MWWKVQGKVGLVPCLRLDFIYQIMQSSLALFALISVAYNQLVRADFFVANDYSVTYPFGLGFTYLFAHCFITIVYVGPYVVFSQLCQYLFTVYDMLLTDWYYTNLCV